MERSDRTLVETSAPIPVYTFRQTHKCKHKQSRHVAVYTIMTKLGNDLRGMIKHRNTQIKKPHKKRKEKSEKKGKELPTAYPAAT